ERELTMKAQTLRSPAPVETHPLLYTDVPVPRPADDEVLVKVSACGICRTDLHVVEGELPPKLPNVIPGHQVVGTVAGAGKGAMQHGPEPALEWHGCIGPMGLVNFVAAGRKISVRTRSSPVTRPTAVMPNM